MAELKLCPNSGCNNTGCIPVQISEDDWEPEQCEFCYTEPDSVFNAIENAKSNAYQQALEDVQQRLLDVSESYNQPDVVRGILISYEAIRDMIREYEKGRGDDGNQ